MKCKVRRSYLLGVAVAFITILIVSATSVALAQTTSLFMPAVFYDSGGGAESVAVADVDSDGKPDLVVAHGRGTATRGRGVGVLLGNGDGTFRPAQTYASGEGFAGFVAVADVNGDGRYDLLVANYCTDSSCEGSVGVLLGNGDGTFQLAVTYLCRNCSELAVADVNGDNKLDLMMTAYTSSLVSVMLGNGDGTFQTAVTYGNGGYSGRSVAVQDVDGDGKPDLIVTNGNSVGVLRGNGDGTFKAPVTYGSGGSYPTSVAVADVNEDRKPDIVVMNSCGVSCVSGGEVGVLLGNGDGTFQSAVSYGPVGYSNWSVTVADVNGDGRPDVLVTSGGSLEMLLGNGDGTFQAPVTYASGGVGLSVVATDLNGDGNPDLVVAITSFCHCWNEGGVALLLSGTGTRGPTTTTTITSGNPVTPSQPVTYTAVVKNESGGTATGMVTFRDGSTPIAIVGLVGNQAAWSTSYAKKGVHSITAEYLGDANNTGGTSATLTEHIVTLLPVWPTTRVATSGSPSFVGQPVTFVARVTSTLGTIPDGEPITFYNGTTAMASVALAGGTASYTTSSLSAKPHYIKAIYTGDAAFRPSSGAVWQVVIKYPTTTTLTSRPNPSAYGQPVTFTAIVSPGGPFAVTGSVRFMNGTTFLGAMKLQNGQATLKYSKLAAGTHPITAQYLGDAYSAKSTSSVVNQVVQ
jgi:hypothetical protein